jgi:tetratricopeptide (TPR) repeat protein
MCRARLRVMVSSFAFLSFLLSQLLLSSSGAAAQTSGVSYTVYGRVTLPDGTGASQVSITISGTSGFTRQVLSDDTGNYEFHDVPRGQYTLAAVNPAAPEQYSERAQVDISRLSPGRIAVNIYLRAGTKVEPAKHGAGVSVAEAAQRIPKAALKEYEKGAKLGGEQKLEKALQSYNRAIEIFPEYFQAITERGHLLVAMGRIPEAREDFTRSLALNPGYEPALRGTGICSLREGKFLEAIKSFEEAVSNQPRDAAAYLFLGFACAAIERREEARAALTKSLNLDPVGSVRAHVQLARLDLKENRNAEAVAELETYLAAVPNAPDADKLRALLAELKNQTPKD